MTINEIIKQYRKDNNLSLRAFAEKANLSHSYISALEKVDPRTNKPIAPTYEVLKQLSKAMGKEIQDLVNVLDSDQEFTFGNIDPVLTTDQKTINLIERSNENQNLLKVLHLLEKLNDNDIKKLIKLINILDYEDKEKEKNDTEKL